MADHDERATGQQVWRDACTAAMESVLGPAEAHNPGSTPPARDDGVEILRFRGHVDGVVTATSGLIGCHDQIPNEQGNYELLICCRGDESWVADALRVLSAYTRRRALWPGETMSIGSMVPGGSSIVAFLFCDYARLAVRGREAGLLLCLGITAGELSQCRNGNWRKVDATLRGTGIYPFTDCTRRSTFKPVIIAWWRLMHRVLPLVLLAVLPPLVLFATLGAWLRVVRLLGPRRAFKNCLTISRLRFRQPLRYVKVNAPGCSLLIFGPFIALFAWALRTHLDQLRGILAIGSIAFAAAIGRRASNKALLPAILALSYVGCFLTSDAVFFWGVSVFLVDLGCIVVESTLQGLLPPLVLFLGVSSYAQFKTLKLVQRSAPGLAATLIDQAEASIVREYERHYRGMGLDPTGPRYESLRTRLGLWEETVRELIDMVPIVILDTRVVSGPVLQEAAWMLQPERWHQALFVTDKEGNAPVLEQILAKAAIVRDHRTRLVREDELPERISRAIRSRDKPLP